MLSDDTLTQIDAGEVADRMLDDDSFRRVLIRFLTGGLTSNLEERVLDIAEDHASLLLDRDRDDRSGAI